MNKSLPFLFYCLLFPFFLSAQWHDRVWNTPGYKVLGDTFFTTTIFDFSKSPMEASFALVPQNYRSARGGVLMSDSSGNPLFFSNTYHLSHANTKLFDNGDGFRPRLNIQNNYYFPTFSASFLALPGTRRGIYHYFQLDQYNNGGGDYGKKDLLYSKLEEVYTDSTGIIAEKNRMIGENQYFRQLTATKHANGRDWWILTVVEDSIFSSHEIWVYALINDEVAFSHKLMPGAIPGVSMLQCYTHNFSPDGKRFFYSIFEGFAMWDFDRCSGALSNLQFIHFPEPGGFNDAKILFSTNSNYVYFLLRKGIYQYDLLASDLDASKILIYENDFIGTPNYINISAKLPLLAFKN